MPKIPVYNIPQVGNAETPSIQTPRARMVDVSSGMESIGNALSNASGTLYKFAMQEQERANTVRVEDAANALREKQLELSQQVQNIRGKNAFDPKGFGGEEGQTLDQVYLGKLDAAAQELMGGLANERQKQMFKEAAQRFRLDFHGQVAQHLAHQDDVVKADTFKSVQQVEQQNVGLNGYVNGKLDEPTVQQSLGRTLSAVDQYADVQGWTPEAREAAKREASTRIYGTVLDQMLASNNIDGAKTYFSVHEKEMDPEAVKGLKSKIEDTSQSIQVLKDVDRISSTGKSLEEQYLEGEQLYASNPKALQEFRMELEHRYTLHKQTQMVAQQEAEGKLWDMRFPTKNGQTRLSMTQIKQTPEWSALDGEQRNKLIAQWETFGKRNENDPSTMVQKFATYWAYASKPEELAKMSDAQIIALTPQMGLSGVQDLLRIKQQLQMPGKVIASNVDSNTIEVFARQNGVVPSTGKLSDDDKVKMGFLKYRVDQQVEQEQQAKKRELTREEKDLIIKRNVVSYQTDEGQRSWLNPARWFGDVNDDSMNKPAFMLTPDDHLYVPPDKRAAIIKEANEHGVMNPTDEQIRARYFQMTQQGQNTPTKVPTVQPTIVVPKMTRGK